MAQYLTEIEVGGHDLLWGATPTNLGSTQEGSELTITTETAPLTVHRYGSTPYEERIIGRAVILDVILLQRDLAKFEDLFGGVVSTGTSSDPFDLDPRPGPTAAAKLEIKPIGAADDSKNYVLWKASPKANSAIPIQIGTQQAFRITFTALVEEDATGNVRLFRIGDPAEVPTAAYFPQP